MSAMSTTTRLPTAIELPLLELETLAALLSCADLEKWDSLGRPSPRGLSALLFRTAAGIETGLDELGIDALQS